MQLQTLFTFWQFLVCELTIPTLTLYSSIVCEQIANVRSQMFSDLWNIFVLTNIYFQVGSQHDMIVNVWDWKNNIKESHL